MIFNRLTVSENLLMGAFQQSNANKKKEFLTEYFNYFKLSKRLNQLGGTLSGEATNVSYRKRVNGSPKL